MSRYSRIPIIKDPTTKINRYSTVKYPSISLGSTDFYVYVTQGDRYDVMAQNYYNNSELWWVIPSSNPYLGFDTLYPAVGSQLRIPNPNRIPNIVSSYERLNGVI
jgi:hypothetical protein